MAPFLTTPSPLCRGFHCVDREACFAYDNTSKVTTLSHESHACDVPAATDALMLQYRNRNGNIEHITAEQAQELMHCTYTSKLLFQSANMLRNYAFWGFTGDNSTSTDTDMDEGFATIAMAASAWSEISSDVAIGHASMLDDTLDQHQTQNGDQDQKQDHGLGLFAVAALELGVFLGEYTGMIQVSSDSGSTHDPYGVCYPSVFERGELRVSAQEFGNEMRCINHSTSPNASFQPMIRRGILHIYCFTTRAVDAGEQIFVNYGPSYWKGAGVEPVEC